MQAHCVILVDEFGDQPPSVLQGQGRRDANALSFQGLEPTLDLAVALRVVWRCLNGSSWDRVHISRASGVPGTAYTSLVLLPGHRTPRLARVRGEGAPRLDAVGVCVIPTPPAPFVANDEPLERSQAWWIGAKSIRMRHRFKAVTGRPDRVGSGRTNPLRRKPSPIPFFLVLLFSMKENQSLSLGAISGQPSWL